MDATALSPEEARELAALRRRAYGPHPDIAADAAAVARLAALEAALHPVAGSASPPRTDRVVAQAPDAASPVAPARGVWADEEPRAVMPPLGPREGRIPPWRRARAAASTAIGWFARRRAVTVAVAFVVVVAIAWGGAQLAAPQSDRSLGRIPAGVDGERLARQGFLDAAGVTVAEVQRFEAYESLQVWVVLADTGDRCLVIDADQYGVLGFNCTPAGLDPVIDLRVWRGMREQVFGDLPPDSFLRFEHIGSRVHVWVRAPLDAP
ncbi:hypothetical protein F6B41_24475 [Microbacterium lushaniae]|nr:hypothetical protein F6B41_24475 [Microbacterium lushaniae]